ncbi:MAG: hypothetical protein IKR59_02640, partial [Lachnospiraceae bacterium]|nr:hypothetical protein [Lachnospiraceae bacterium]
SASEAGPNPAESFPEKLEKTVRMLDKMKQALREAGMPVMETEPLKLTLQVPGVELGEKLLDNGISYEFADPENLVLMPGPENTEEELQRCLEVLLGLADDFRRRDTGYTQNNPQNNPQNDIQKIPKILPENSLQHAVGNDQRLPLAERVLSIREAVFAPHETIPVSQSIGRIAASPTVSCPPAVPIVVSGERISAEAAAAFARYGIGTVEVVREAR